MEITWLGQGCFRIRAKDATIVTDPNEKSSSQLARLPAEIVTVSHVDPKNKSMASVAGTPRVVDGPGEYEIAGVFLTGVRTFRDVAKGKDRGYNVVYLIETEELVVCHLGDLGHVPDAAQMEQITNVDVLLVPLGGDNEFNAANAAETVRRVEPKIVVPMLYSGERTSDHDSLVEFLKQMGVTGATPQARLMVTRASLPPIAQVVVLEVRS